MKYHNFYMRILCLILIVAAILGYNYMQKDNARQAEFDALKEKVTELEQQQTEILTALEENAKAQEEAKAKQEEAAREAAQKASESASQEEQGETDEDGFYKDGTYDGEGSGFGGAIQVQVTLEDQAITDIQVVSAPGEDGTYLSMAKGVIDTIIAQQSTAVDTVSGATFSSTGILNAVEDALGKAENQ